MAVAIKRIYKYHEYLLNFYGNTKEDKKIRYKSSKEKKRLNQYLNCLCKTKVEEEKCKWNVTYTVMPCSNNQDR